MLGCKFDLSMLRDNLLAQSQVWTLLSSLFMDSSNSEMIWCSQNKLESSANISAQLSTLGCCSLTGEASMALTQRCSSHLALEWKSRQQKHGENLAMQEFIKQNTAIPKKLNWSERESVRKNLRSKMLSFIKKESCTNHRLSMGEKLAKGKASKGKKKRTCHKRSSSGQQCKVRLHSST